MEERFYSPDEIAAKLGVTPITVRRYVADGKLKAIRPGGHIIRVGESEYRRFIGEQNEH